MSGQIPYWTLDDSEVDVRLFMEVNDLDDDTIREIYAMKPGDEKIFGGGAAPIFTLKRY